MVSGAGSAGGGDRYIWLAWPGRASDQCAADGRLSVSGDDARIFPWGEWSAACVEKSGTALHDAASGCISGAYGCVARCFPESADSVFWADRGIGTVGEGEKE